MPSKIDLSKMDLNRPISIARLYEYYEDTPRNYASHRLALSVAPEKRQGGVMPWVLVLDNDNFGILYDKIKRVPELDDGFYLDSEDESKSQMVRKFDLYDFKEQLARLNAVNQNMLKQEIIKQARNIFAGRKDLCAVSFANKFSNTPSNELALGEVLELSKTVRAMGSIYATAIESEKEKQIEQIEKRKSIYFSHMPKSTSKEERIPTF